MVWLALSLAVIAGLVVIGFDIQGPGGTGFR